MEKISPCAKPVILKGSTVATEENKEVEAGAGAEEKNSAVKNIVQIVEDENSYINSAKERMNDVIDTFITNAENSVALNDFFINFQICYRVDKI